MLSGGSASNKSIKVNSIQQIKPNEPIHASKMLLSSSDFKIKESKNEKMTKQEEDFETESEKARNLKAEYIKHVLPLKFDF